MATTVECANVIAAREWWIVIGVVAGGCGKPEFQEISASAIGITNGAIPDCKTVSASLQFRTKVLGLLKIKDDTKLYPDEDAIWPHWQSIPVCWEHANHADGVEELRRGVTLHAPWQ